MYRVTCQAGCLLTSFNMTKTVVVVLVWVVAGIVLTFGAVWSNAVELLK